MISGEKWSQEIRINQLADVAGRQIIVNFGPLDLPFAACRADGFDVKFTLADGVTAVPFYRLRWVATGFAQFMLKLPADIAGNPLVQWGDAAAADVSSFQNTVSLPNGADCDALACWPMTESGTFVDTVAGVSLTISGNTTHRNLSDLGFARRPARITQQGGDPAWASDTACGMYTNTTGFAQADAGFLDAPPASGSIHFYSWCGGGAYGTVLSKYSDANNFLRLEFIAGNKYRLTKKNAGVTNTFTSTTVTDFGNTALLSIQWGSGGFEFLIHGTPVYRDPADTGAWGSGATGRFTLGGYDTGTVGDKLQSFMVMTLTVHSRRLTYGEIGHKCYLMRPPLNLRTQAEKLQYRSVANDAAAAWEAGLVQELTMLGSVAGVFHAIYHGGVTGQVGHMTSPDRVTWTKDANNPVLGGGVHGEAGETLAVNGGRMGDGFWVSYCNTFTGALKKAITADFVSFSTPTTVLAVRAADWPLGNTNAFGYQSGQQFLMAVEGVNSVSGVAGQFTIGMARGHDIDHLTLDASVTDGAGFKTSPATSLSLMYGGNNLYPLTQTGGPFVWVAPSGLQHFWVHGDAGKYQTSSCTFIYHRSTWDGVNFFEHPNDVVLAAMREITASADQAADPYLDDLGGTGAAMLWCEMFFNAGPASKIAQFVYSGNLQSLVADSPRAEVGPVVPAPTRRPTGTSLLLGIL
jgi:hypothetical protein